jgi:hypothetical protein
MKDAWQRHGDGKDRSQSPAQRIEKFTHSIAVCCLSTPRGSYHKLPKHVSWVKEGEYTAGSVLDRHFFRPRKFGAEAVIFGTGLHTTHHLSRQSLLASRAANNLGSLSAS